MTTKRIEGGHCLGACVNEHEGGTASTAAVEQNVVSEGCALVELACANRALSEASILSQQQHRSEAAVVIRDGDGRPSRVESEPVQARVMGGLSERLRNWASMVGCDLCSIRKRS